MIATILTLLATLQLGAAHFSVSYPTWRGDSFKTQWERPCGGVNQTAETEANRTAWPIDGGSVVFKGSHAWAYTFVNLALGTNSTTYNITLVEGFNQTGNGTFCFPRLPLPEGTFVTQGANASIQVVQVNEHGSALYNCADITFSENATVLGSDQCQNATGVGGTFLTDLATVAAAANASESSSPTGSGASASSQPNSAALNVMRSGTLVSALAILAAVLF